MLMTCPVCKRELAPTLSICLTCGAMMNDSVREELETKITSNSGELNRKKSLPNPPQPEFLSGTITPNEVPANSNKTLTSELTRKHTSPTLVEFQSKNSALPDWRLQMQNAVRQRGGSAMRQPNPTQRQAFAQSASSVAASSSNALKLEIETVSKNVSAENPRLRSAMERIERSRKMFLPNTAERTVRAENLPQQRKFPFDVVTPKKSRPLGNEQAPRSADSSDEIGTADPRSEEKAYDTNKLPKLESVIKEPRKLGLIVDGEDFQEPLFTNESKKLERHEEKDSERSDLATEQDVEDEFDDLAPFSMRVGSGLFDLIIGVFATLIILSPFMMSGGAWASIAGVLAVIGALGIFMFLYLTASIAFWGKTFGMRLFSLELIDAEANAYPTVHQAAVNSAVYLLSMALGGLGFLTIPFSNERRAIHDIISGTLLVREA